MAVDQRKRLLEAAISCLQERGYARTTTRDIVAAAGSHLPAVNYYFGSKERLLAEAIIEGLHRWMESTVASALDPVPATASERLRRGLDRYLATLDADRPYVVAAFEAYAQASRGDDLRDRLAAVYQQLRASLAADVATLAAEEGHRLEDAESAAVASVLIALFDGLAIQWLLDPRRVPDADQLMRALELVAASIVPGATNG